MKAIILVLDSFGIGGAADARQYGDEGSNTYRAIAKGIKVPNLVRLGLNNIDFVDATPKCEAPVASYARLIESSCAKDTTTGHYELMGIVTRTPYPTYPQGFDKEIIDQLIKAWGVGGVLGNKAASGTQIIEELGNEHLATGYPIVYTSADSVLQIACCDTLYPIDKLYDMCIKARRIMCGKNNVARVIARPFAIDEDGHFYRTAQRKDFGLVPQEQSVLDVLQQHGIETIAIGKINDIFSGAGISRAIEAHNNREVVDATIDAIKRYDNCLIFSNLVDFDMLYGHRNDVEGYKKCLEDFDLRLPEIIKVMDKEDLLVITADHGCDPSTPSTDHSRENVPAIFYTPKDKNVCNYGTIQGFDFVGKQICKFFKINK
ncbi:MAG: phosphopentomutase [Christensenellales bacterium]